MRQTLLHKVCHKACSHFNLSTIFHDAFTVYSKNIWNFKNCRLFLQISKIWANLFNSQVNSIKISKSTIVWKRGWENVWSTLEEGRSVRSKPISSPWNSWQRIILAREQRQRVHCAIERESRSRFTALVNACSFKALLKEWALVTCQVACFLLARTRRPLSPRKRTARTNASTA